MPPGLFLCLQQDNKNEYKNLDFVVHLMLSSLYAI